LQLSHSPGIKPELSNKLVFVFENKMWSGKMMQPAVNEKQIREAETKQRMIQFVKQNYKGLYSMSQWVENRKKGLIGKPVAAAK
jgi:hypothetical protein